MWTPLIFLFRDDVGVTKLKDGLSQKVLSIFSMESKGNLLSSIKNRKRLNVASKDTPLWSPLRNSTPQCMAVACLGSLSLAYTQTPPPDLSTLVVYPIWLCTMSQDQCPEEGRGENCHKVRDKWPLLGTQYSTRGANLVEHWIHRSFILFYRNCVSEKNQLKSYTVLY